MELEFWANGMVERGDKMSGDDGQEVNGWRNGGNFEFFWACSHNLPLCIRLQNKRKVKSHGIILCCVFFF